MSKRFIILKGHTTNRDLVIKSNLISAVCMNNEVCEVHVEDCDYPYNVQETPRQVYDMLGKQEL